MSIVEIFRFDLAPRVMGEGLEAAGEHGVFWVSIRDTGWIGVVVQSSLVLKMEEVRGNSGTLTAC